MAMEGFDSFEFMLENGRARLHGWSGLIWLGWMASGRVVGAS